MNLRLTPWAVRWAGAGLIAGAVLLPVSWVILRAARWQAPEVISGEVPEVQFMMGSPEGEEGRFDWETQHSVTLKRHFALAATEVTQGQYESLMGENPVGSRVDFFDRRCSLAGEGADLPVVCVSWEEAVKFCNALSDRDKLPRAYKAGGEGWEWIPESTGYRLPTEAEWEYMARAGKQTKWVGTDKVEEVCEFANVADRSAKQEYPDWETFECDDGYSELSPVRARRPNAWGYYGMGGNAAEWVWDGFEGFASGAVEDPEGDPRVSIRVIRGGSWRSSPRSARAAIRYRGSPSLRRDILGFRVARSKPSALDPLDPWPEIGPQRSGSASAAAGAGEARDGGGARR